MDPNPPAFVCTVQIIKDPAQLVVANAMDGAMYSTTQFLGSAAGGLFTAWLGTCTRLTPLQELSTRLTHFWGQRE